MIFTASRNDHVSNLAVWFKEICGMEIFYTRKVSIMINQSTYDCYSLLMA